jgi:hypothetical protein
MVSDTIFQSHREAQLGGTRQEGLEPMKMVSDTIFPHT